jgi:predicted DNA-binding WGR domain protein
VGHDVSENWINFSHNSTSSGNQAGGPNGVVTVNMSQNMNRFYHMTVQRDLFGGASLIRVWGRIGTAGRQRIDTFVDEGRAVSALMALSQQKRRRCYSSP